MKFRNFYSPLSGEFEKDIELNEGISQTVPDQSFTIKEILQKFSSGIPLSIGGNGEYSDLEDFEAMIDELRPDFDLTDVEGVISYANEIIKKANEIKEDETSENQIVEEPQNK